MGQVTTSDSIIRKIREQKYKRNYIALLLDGFFFSFSASIFSHTTVLPVYVSNLSSNSIFISLLAVSFFGLSNGASIFSCILGVNTKTPKWTAIRICLTQRIGFFLILMSTYAISESRTLAIGLFFFSYAVYGTAAGMSGPVHSTLVSNTIYRNVASFYGTYSLSGAFAGVIGAQVIRILLEKYAFPVNYRLLFFWGLVVAMLSTLSLAIGISEVKEDHGEKMYFSRLPGAFKEILQKNKDYRSFLLIRILAAMAEMSIPFYIIRVKSMDNAGEKIVGTMTTVLLASNMVTSQVIGRLGDRLGPVAMARVSVSAGILAAFLALIMPSPQWGYLLFILVSIAVTGNALSNSVANIHYASRGMVPVYTASSGIIVAPFYALFSFGGGLLANHFSIMIVFILSVIFYTLALLFSLPITRKPRF